MSLGDFSPQADAYQRSRPTYPATLVDELVREAGVAPGDAVADFGAGTGIFTQLLVERGFRVTAVEPNASMREQTTAHRARWIQGTFENSSLADQSQRWATAAQAFHWADPKRALPEIRRVLAPNSLFTVLWNNRALRASAIVQWTEEAIQRHIPEFREAYRERSWRELLESTGDFTVVSHRTERHTISMSHARYLDLWRSHNRLNTLAGPERFAAFFTELGEYLARGKIATIDVPYDCEAWSARRTD